MGVLMHRQSGARAVTALCALLVPAGLAAQALMAEGAGAGAPKEPVVIIVARSAPQEDISSNSLRRLFLGLTRKGAAGHSLIPLNHPPRTPVRAVFDRRVLGMSPEEVGRYWVDRRLRGRGGRPRSVSSRRGLLRAVARHPGLVAYVPLSWVDSSVRILRIDGRDHGHPDYLLAPRK